MNRLTLRPILATAAAAIVCLAMSPRPGATGNLVPFVERLVAAAVNMTPGGPEPLGRIDIVIERWSTEVERANLLRTTIDGGPARLLPALRTVTRRAGFVQSPGRHGLGARARERRAQNFQFAQEIKTPTGRQVVIATDQHLGFGEPPARTQVVIATDQHPDSGEKTDNVPLPEPEFTLLDIRFGPDGNGVGKMAPAAKVAYNPTKKIFEIQNYAAQPVRLSEVKSATR